MNFHQQVGPGVFDAEPAGEIDRRCFRGELRAPEGDHAVVEREVGRAAEGDRVGGVRESLRVPGQGGVPLAGTGQDPVFVPVVDEVAGSAAAQTVVVDAPIAEELLDGDSAVAKVDLHRIRLDVLRQIVVPGNRAAAVRCALDVDDGTVAGDVHRPADVGEVVNVGAEFGRKPAAGDRDRAPFTAQRAIDVDQTVEHFVDFERVADAIEPDLRGEVKVVDRVAERRDLPVQKDPQVRSALERDGLQVEIVGCESELASQRRSDRHCIRKIDRELRTGEHTAVEIFLRRDVDRGGDVARGCGDRVAAVEIFEGAARDIKVAEVEVVDLVPRRRAGVPVRKVVGQFGAGGVDLEVETRLDDVDAPDANLASPEGVDAAGDDELLCGSEVGVDRPGRVGDAQVVDDDAALPSALDLHRSDVDVTAEARFERLLDAQAHQAGEAGRPEVPPAAADDQRKEHEEADGGTSHPLETAPHRASPLPLSRGAVVVLLGCWFDRHFVEAANSC